MPSSSAGHAFIFVNAFEIHTASGLRHPQTLQYLNRRIDVYPPFANADGLRFRRELDRASLPYRPGTVSPDAVLPRLETSGRPNWGAPYRLGDALRIDVFPCAQDDTDIPTSVSRHLCALIRIVTRQCWIGRGPSEAANPLQNSFPVDRSGQPHGRTLYKTEHVMPHLGTESLLTEERFKVACEMLASGAIVPRPTITLFDAVYATLHQNREEAVLLGAIASEELLAEQAYAAHAAGRISRPTLRKVLKTRDLRERLSVGTGELFGRSFADEHPVASRSIGDIWVARHALAHGSRAQIERNDTLRSQDRFFNGMKGVFTFFEWCARLVPRAHIDPMYYFIDPLVRAT